MNDRQYDEPSVSESAPTTTPLRLINVTPSRPCSVSLMCGELLGHWTKHQMRCSATRILISTGAAGPGRGEEVSRRQRRDGAGHAALRERCGSGLIAVGMGDSSDTASCPVPLAADLFCPACGYNLRGGVGERCPECGKAYDISTLSASRIPWTNRQQIGRLRAFIRTIWIATAHPRRIADSLQAELTLRDGRLFLVISMAPVAVVLHELLTPVGREKTITELMIQWGGPMGAEWPVDVLYPLYRGLSLWPVCVCVATGLSLSLGLMPARVALFGGYPEAIRQRIIAGAHYLSGAWIGGGLVGVVVSVIFALLLLAMSGKSWTLDTWIRVAGHAPLYLIPATTVLIWFRAWWVYRRAAAVLSGRRAFPLWLLVPLLLLLYLFVWLAMLPWCIGLLILITSTLR